MAGLSWKSLLAAEPELVALARLAKAGSPSGVCAEAWWRTRSAMQMRLTRVVGPGRIRRESDDAEVWQLLSSVEALDMARKRLWQSVPDCPRSDGCLLDGRTRVRRGRRGGVRGG